jgi:hypothetical protein
MLSIFVIACPLHRPGSSSTDLQEVSQGLAQAEVLSQMI